MNNKYRKQFKRRCIILFFIWLVMSTAMFEYLAIMEALAISIGIYYGFLSSKKGDDIYEVQFNVGWRFLLPIMVMGGIRLFIERFIGYDIVNNLLRPYFLVNLFSLNIWWGLQRVLIVLSSICFLLVLGFPMKEK